MSGDLNTDPSALEVLAELQMALQRQLPGATLARQAPPYWSFCWASGQVLARWLLDHAKQIRGRTVVDVGPGSGVVTAADILYDRDNLALLAQFRAAPRVLLADSRVRDLSPPGYCQIGRFTANAWPDLGESPEFNQVTLYEYCRLG